MQLILTQTDIELALKNYVNEILTVREGMVITVDLKATRGADGATAIIDISPASEPKAEPVKPGSADQQASGQPSGDCHQSEVVKDDKPKAEAQPETQAAEPEVAAEAATTVAADANAAEESAQVADEQAPEAAVETEVEAQAEAEPATTKPQSLFAGLRKPKND